MYVTKKNIASKLKQSGIKKGDIVFFSSSLGTVGVPKQTVKTKNDLCKLFFENFKEAVGGKGNI